jgi:ABC-type thiamine transport system substrate-binding protein
VSIFYILNFLIAQFSMSEQFPNTLEANKLPTHTYDWSRALSLYREGARFRVMGYNATLLYMHTFRDSLLRRGRGHMVVGFMTIFATSAYHR